MFVPLQALVHNSRDRFLAQISVSLNVVSKIDRTVTLHGTTTLAQMQTGFKNQVSVFDDALFVVSYHINQPDRALYELGVRTGDIFIVVMNDSPIGDGLGVNVLRPSVDVLEVSDNATAGDILRELSKLLGTPAHRLYIGRYAANLEQTLDNFGLVSGDLISLALLPTRVDYELLLVPARGAYSPFHVKGTSAVMGGSNESIDISHILPRRKRHLIQGAQAEFVRLNDVWHVQALPTANMPLFVDSHRLFPHHPKALFENNVISLGSSPTEPLLQLVVQFNMD
jgi:hypothetical protein